MKKFFVKIKNWFVRHAPSKRRIIQLYSALLHNAQLKGFITGDIYKGSAKKMCVPGLNCYSCPGAVGACPLGSLQNALGESSVRTPTYVIGILAIFALTLARTICGWLCPVGLGQDLLYKIKTPKIKKSKVTRVLSYFKYFVLVGLGIIVPLMFAVPGFCEYICPAGTMAGILSFPTNEGWLAMLGPFFTWKFMLLIVIVVLSIFCYRSFCRFLCPLGALYGFFNKIALLGVKLDKNKCTDCGLCQGVCPMDIKTVGDHECIQCGKCISVCPAKAISWKGSKLFVRKNDTDMPVETESKSLLAMVKPKEDTGEEKTENVATTEIVENVEGAENTEIAETTENVENTERGEMTETPPTEEKSVEQVPVQRKRAKWKEWNWWKIGAWSLATAVVCGSLIYFNLPDKGAQEETLGVINGDCPDFEVDYIYTAQDGKMVIDEGKTFKLSEHEGDVIVINFWATYCQPCKVEIPHFNELYENYHEQGLEVVILNGEFDKTAQGLLDKFVNNSAIGDYATYYQEWQTFSCTFGRFEENNNILEKFDVGAALPVTIVVGRDGKIKYMAEASLSYQDLVNIVEPELAKTKE